MMPNDALSSTPVPGAFLPPRTSVRYNAAAGLSDVALGPTAIGNTSEGIQFQEWTAYADSTGNIWLTAPNTAPYIFLPNVGAVWVALAFDQNGRVFLAWSTATGQASYYWYNTLTNSYTTSALSGYIPRVFAALDDARPQQSSQSDILFCYVLNGELCMRQQRDRYGVVYNLAAVPVGTLVQVGFSTKNRFQFAFQGVQGNPNTAGNSVLPPAEYQLNVGGVINVPE